MTELTGNLHAAQFQLIQIKSKDNNYTLLNGNNILILKLKNVKLQKNINSASPSMLFETELLSKFAYSIFDYNREILDKSPIKTSNYFNVHKDMYCKFYEYINKKPNTITDFNSLCKQLMANSLCNIYFKVNIFAGDKNTFVNWVPTEVHFIKPKAIEDCPDFDN